jgi:hypothetical protein
MASLSSLDSKTCSDRYLKLNIIFGIIEKHAASSQVCAALRMARATQRLQMPSSHPQLPRSASDDQVMGTSDQWLGVSVSSCLTPLSSVTDQSMVLQTVRSQLDQWAARVALTLYGSNNQKDQRQLTGLAEVVLRRKEAIRAKQIQALIHTKSILRDTLKLLRLHQSITDKCLAFASDVVVTRQPKLDQTNIDYDSSWTRVMQAKLMAMEAQMELQTYGNPPHLLALSKVHSLISESRAKAEEATAQVMMKLSCYQALGPAFELVAAEYGRVLKQLHETQAMIARLKEMETDLPDSRDD